MKDDTKTILSLLAAFVASVFLYKYLQNNVPKNYRNAIAHHAIMSITSIPRNKAEHYRWDHMIHRSISSLDKKLRNNKEHSGN